MKNTCKLSLVWCLLILLAWSVSALPVTNGSSPVLACKRVQLGDGWQLVGIPFKPFAVARGTVLSVQANQVLLAGGDSWATNQWVNYEIQITSGQAVGQRCMIAQNGVGSLQLAGNGNSAQLSVGDTYEILPTLEEYLGSQLVGADDATKADAVAVYQQDQSISFYRNSAGKWLDTSGNQAWVSVANGSGLWINTTIPRSVILSGRYQSEPEGIEIVTGTQIISAPSVGPSLTLSALNWSGAVAGGAPNASDKLSIWNDAESNFRTCWLNAATGRWTWQDTGEDASGFILASGQISLYQHIGSEFNLLWR